MNDLLLMPAAVASNNSNQFVGEYTDYEEIVDQPVTSTQSYVSFLDANTNIRTSLSLCMMLLRPSIRVKR